MINIIIVFVLVAIFGTVCNIERVPQCNGRIVGGVDANIEDYNYQISVQHQNDHVCGGALISREWVATAAHCTNGRVTSDLTIRAGSSFRNTEGVVIQVKSVYQNPNYSDWTYDNDISILLLSVKVNLTKAIGLIGLPVLNQDVTTTALATVTGWGFITETGPAANQLQVLQIPIVDWDACSEIYWPWITENMLCAGYIEGEKDTCSGDSGGPLVINNQLIGIVSWGKGCAVVGFPGVYSSIPILRDYITEICGF